MPVFIYRPYPGSFMFNNPSNPPSISDEQAQNNGPSCSNRYQEVITLVGAVVIEDKVVGGIFIPFEQATNQTAGMSRKGFALMLR
jgi:hypothetical protein